MKKKTSKLLIFVIYLILAIAGMLLSLFGCQSKIAEVKVVEGPTFDMKTDSQYANAINVAMNKRNNEIFMYIPENYDIKYANVIYDREFSKNELLNAPLEENIVRYIVCIADSFDVQLNGKKEKVKDTNFYLCQTTKELWAEYMEKYLVDDKEKTKNSLKEGIGLAKDLLSLDIIGVASDVYDFYNKNDRNNYNEKVNEILRNVTEDNIKASYIEYAKFIIDLSKCEAISINDLSKYFENKSDLDMAKALVSRYGESKDILEKLNKMWNGEDVFENAKTQNDKNIEIVEEKKTTKKMQEENNNKSVTKSEETSTEKKLFIEVGNIGDEVYFGRCEWIVLSKDEKEKTALLLQKYGGFYLDDNNDFGDLEISLDWENSEIRKFLNSEAYEYIYRSNYDNKNAIVLSEIENKNGKNTKDYVFLLSRDEIEQYIPNEEHRILKSQMLSDTTNYKWLTRSISASDNNKIVFVGADGKFKRVAPNEVSDRNIMRLRAAINVYYK